MSLFLTRKRHGMPLKVSVALVLSAVALNIAAAPAQGAKGQRADSGQPAASSPAQQDKCDCESPYREYKAADTPQTAALFAAVEANDEAAFSAALSKVDRPGDYALNGMPLLHAVLMPPRDLRSKDKTYWDMAPADAERIRQAWQAQLQVRTRMLAALLATHPALDDATYESRRPSLHLALLYGTPEIMDMLLAAGAKPDQRGDDYRKPLEFLLNRDFEFAVRMTYMPRLVDRAAMARMVVALFKAGATRPYLSIDERPNAEMLRALTDKQGRVRPAADHLVWSSLVELTEGAEPLRALAATGSKPADEEALNALMMAAYTGNAGALPLLMDWGPRMVPNTAYGATHERDAWLDAAQAAIAGGHPDIARQLLRKDMPFGQTSDRVEGTFVKIEAGSKPILNVAASSGDVATVKQLLALGAPVDGDPAEEYGVTPLADAVKAHQAEVVTLLLAAGADPLLQRKSSSESALSLAVQMDDPFILRALLPASKPDALKAVLRDPKRSPVNAVLAHPGRHSVEMLQQLVRAGADLKALDASAILQALQNQDEPLAAYLIDAGVPVNPAPHAPASDENYADWRSSMPPLQWALTARQNTIVEQLLAKGADPLALTPDGASTLFQVIARRDEAMLDRLQRAGARLDDPRLPRAPEPYALLNAALLSGDAAMLGRISQANGQSPSMACLLPETESILLDTPGYFKSLRKAGFTGTQNACAKGLPLSQRVVRNLLNDPRLAVARHDTVVDVLRQLKANGANLDAAMDNGATALNNAIQLGREDVAATLLAAGASPDAADAKGRSPAWVALETGQPGMLTLLARYRAHFDDAAAPEGQSFSRMLACHAAPRFSQAVKDAGVTLKPVTCTPPAAALAGGKTRQPKPVASLPGHYYLQGVREVGGELQLSKDGRFDYAMSYGAVDILAQGTWRSDGKRVYLDTPPVEPASVIGGVRAQTKTNDPADQLTVRVYMENRPVKVQVAMSSAEVDYAGKPTKTAPSADADSDRANGVAAPIAPGALKALAVFLPLPSGERWYTVDIAKLDPTARSIRIDLALPDSVSRSPLHMMLVLNDDGALVDGERGRLRYVKQ